ncbi:hypothetical protein CIK05_03845 [Bdellovibrio sp. qaytius]|nr:hypothetical protein CIK05_03845 [Bdellovibrio sp. qaytius]
MKFFKTIILALFAVAFTGGIYYYTVVREKQHAELTNLQVVYLKKDQINYLEIQNKNVKYVFQKNDKGWNIEEPITDIADDQRLDEVITQLTNEKQIAIAKEGPGINWAEFGLDTPETLMVIKNNLGQSQKIFISATKNFEGNHYARIDNNEKILVVSPSWYNYSTEKLTYFREKSLYRGQIAAIKKITIKSLQDHFSLINGEKGWSTPVLEAAALDQNKIRAMIKAIAENSIQEYVSEGDPSDMERKEKGLNQDYAEVTFETETDHWSVVVNINQKDKALYALTEKPTYLVKLDLSQWELFGNLNLDALRDRKTMMRFDAKMVNRVFVKNGNKSLQLIKEDSKWRPEDAAQAIKIKVKNDDVSDLINQVHDLEITYFLPEADGKDFAGNDMIILKTSEDQLLFQLNWGPLHHKKVSGLEQDYFLARTAASDSIFGLNKSYIDKLPLEKILKDQVVPSEAPETKESKGRKK